MNSNDQPNQPGRRMFMRAVACGGVAAGMLAGTRLGVAAETTAPPMPDNASPPQQQATGYHVTEHIREYYRKAAF